MPYDQKEANRRFSGLLELWKQFHVKVKGEVTTDAEFRALHAEGKKLVESYNEEMAQFLELCEKEEPYFPNVERSWDIQGHMICSGMHLQEIHDRVCNIKAGKAAFNEMIGKPAKGKTPVWN